MPSLYQMTLQSYVLNIEKYGCIRGGYDNQSILESIFSNAKNNNIPVYIPHGDWYHSSYLTADGIIIFGDGYVSNLVSTDSHYGAIVLTGSNAKVFNFRVSSPNLSTRWANIESAGIGANAANNFTIENIIVNGAGSVGFKSINSSNGRIINNDISGTLADGIHNTDGSNNIQIFGNRLTNVGDDGIAVVSYVSDTNGICHDISIESNSVNTTSARAYSCVGGENIRIENNKAVNIGQSGVYCVSENSFLSNYCKNIKIKSNTLVDCGTIGTNSPILVQGRSGYLAKTVLIEDNDIYGSGSIAFTASQALSINTNSEDVILVNNKIHNITDISSGIFIKGNNVDVINNKIWSLPCTGILLDAGAKGIVNIKQNYLYDIANTNSGTKRGIDLQTNTEIIKVEYSNNVIIDGTYALTTAIFNNLSRDKYLARDNLVNGAKINDYESIYKSGSSYIIDLTINNKNSFRGGVFLKSSETLAIKYHGTRSNVSFGFKSLKNNDQNVWLRLSQNINYKNTTSGNGTINVDYILLSNGTTISQRTDFVAKQANGTIGTFELTNDGNDIITMTYIPSTDEDIYLDIHSIYKSG